MNAQRTLYIGIAPREYIKQRTIAIARGERPSADEPKHWVSSLEALGRILSKKNMLLIEMIRHSRPESMTELAAMSGRARSNLSRTLRSMERIGFIEFEQKISRARKAPRLRYDTFQINAFQSREVLNSKEAA